MRLLDWPPPFSFFFLRVFVRFSVCVRGWRAALLLLLLALVLVRSVAAPRVLLARQAAGEARALRSVTAPAHALSHTYRACSLFFLFFFFQNLLLLFFADR